MNFLGYSIELKIKKRGRKARGFSSKRWTTSEINTMLRLKGENKSDEYIAKELNRTIPAIFSKLTKVRKIKNENHT